jgi:hypothetical protein
VFPRSAQTVHYNLAVKGTRNKFFTLNRDDNRSHTD